MNAFDRMVRSTLGGGVPLTIFILAIAAGIAALQFTPREEEPQIVVPMVEVLVEAPGLSAEQVARQVATPVEKLLAQIPGVEHVYSTSVLSMFIPPPAPARLRSRWHFMLARIARDQF